MFKDGTFANSFDKLVSGISAEERRFLLEKLKNENIAARSDTLDFADAELSDTRTLEARIQTESFFYRVMLWLRALFTTQSRETLYNKDFLAAAAHKTARAHPGLIDFSQGVLESLFYEKLKDLHDCASFFKPYLAVIYDAAGEFYVFLSTFIAPEIAEHIDNEADPYTISFDRPLTNELRVSLMRKLDAAVRDISRDAKAALYEAVRTTEWLRQYCAIYRDCIELAYMSLCERSVGLRRFCTSACKRSFRFKRTSSMYFFLCTKKNDESICTRYRC